MKPISVGIDLGTTYSAIATFSKELGSVEILKNSLQEQFTPSVLCFNNNDVLFGEDAKEEQKSGSPNVASFYKNYMGNPNYKFSVHNKEYTAEDLSSLFISKLVKDIEKTNQVTIKNAVVTVPAYFDEFRRMATMNAARRAGLNVLKIINEPTSAIIAYGLAKGGERTVMVYDLGGGTFDVSIARVQGSKIDVIATNGDHMLGGRNWDIIITELCANQIMLNYGLDLNDFPDAKEELIVKSEEAKKRLTSVASTTTKLYCGTTLCTCTITKAEFDDRSNLLLDNTRALIEECFSELSSKLNKSFSWRDIDEVLLVGGSTRMPQVRHYLEHHFGKPPLLDADVDTIVASGAAMQAEMILHNQITVKVAGGSRGRAPGIASLVIKNSDISDITSHAMGMLAFPADGQKTIINSAIIPKNSKVNEPYSRNYLFAGDELVVYVMQGESRDPRDANLIGKYVISKPSETSENIQINYLYDNNGIIQIYAISDKGKQVNAVKQPLDGTLEEIIARLLKEREEQEKLARQLDVLIAIDVSGSMYGRPVEKSKKAAKEFVNSLDLKYAKVSIATFGENYYEHCVKSNKSREILRAIDKIDALNEWTSAQPIKKWYPHMDTSSSIPVMIILTDGVWDNQTKEIATSKKARKAGITIYAIGFGDADERFLEQISDGRSIKVDLNSLTTAFQKVATSIATELAQGRALHNK